MENKLQERKERLQSLQWMRKATGITWSEWAREMGVASGSLTSTTYMAVVSESRLVDMAEALDRVMARREKLLKELQEELSAQMESWTSKEPVE